jgi:hypothetical protein
MFQVLCNKILEEWDPAPSGKIVEFLRTSY